MEADDDDAMRSGQGRITYAICSYLNKDQRSRGRGDYIRISTHHTRCSKIAAAEVSK